MTTVPEWHPQHDTFEPFPVHAWLIRHPDGAILVDTGIGVGNEAIDEWYHPHVTPLFNSLGGTGVLPSDIAAVVISHLHFDHCGQQDVLTAPVYVQAIEFEVAQTPGYTVPDGAAYHRGSIAAGSRGLRTRRGGLLVVHTGSQPGPSIGVGGGGGRACGDRSAVCLSSSRAAERRTSGHGMPRGKPGRFQHGSRSNVSVRWLQLRLISATTRRSW